MVFVSGIFVSYFLLMPSITRADNDTGQLRSSSDLALYVKNSGDDSGDGLTFDTALKTLSVAIEKAKANQEIKTIYICNTQRLEGTLSLEGSQVIIKRYSKYDYTLFVVESGKEATIENVTIDGNAEENENISGSLVEISKNATLNIKDGAVLQNNYRKIAYDAQSLAGGAIMCLGTLNMSGGVISNNIANRGGGVFITSVCEPQDYMAGKYVAAVMNFSGGTIKNNKAINYDIANGRAFTSGGGICLSGGGILNMSSSAEVIENHSETSGGGIAVGDLRGDLFDLTFTMTGGKISKNTSVAGGAGLFVQSSQDISDEVPDFKFYNKAVISGGEITYNKTLGNSLFGGGGIYVNGAPASPPYDKAINGLLFLTNAIIRDNKAQTYGAGYAACPSSQTTIYLKNGVAIYHNKVSANVGNDVYLEGGNIWPHVGSCPFSISPIMLGGTPYRWKLDDGKEINLNALTGSLSDNQRLALHTDVVSSPEAEAQAKVLIAYNESNTAGGGIGTNGSVFMGEEDFTSVKVNKKWVDKDATKRPNEVKVALYRSFKDKLDQKELVGYETIKGAKWELEFTYLPKHDNQGNDFIYSIKEEKVKGYVSKVSSTKEKEFTLTNTKQIEKINLEIKKIWQGGPKDKPTITIELLRNGSKLKEVTLPSGTTTYTFTDLDKTDNAGKEYIYTIKEKELKGYKSVVKGYVITNTFVPTIPLTPLRVIPKTSTK